MNTFEQLPSRLNDIPGFIAKTVKVLKDEFEIMTENELFDLRLALEEALTNAMKHGNKLNPDLKVDVSIVTNGNRLTIEIKDEGSGYDFQDVPDPTSKDKRLLTSGRGVFLIKKVMDEVSFLEGGRGIRMVKEFGKM